MSDLNELFAELKASIPAEGTYSYSVTLEQLYVLDERINNGEFARAEQDAYIG